MTKTVHSHLTEVTNLTEELDPLYPPENTDYSTDATLPDTFIPSSQKVQMTVLLENLQKALQNTYTTDPDEQKQIGEYLFTVEMRSEQLSAIPETYSDLSTFYRDSIRPLVTEATEFIDSSHTPIVPQIDSTSLNSEAPQ